MHNMILCNIFSKEILIFTIILLNMKIKLDKDMTVFGRNLLGLRRDKHLSQEKLAYELGITRYTVSYYESRAKNPTVDFVQKVANYFRVSTDQLLCEASEKRPKPGPKSKIEAQLEAIRKLPAKKQKTVSEMLDMVLT